MPADASRSSTIIESIAWSQRALASSYAPRAEPVQLTDHPGLDARPSWSPDGKQFAFESARDGDVAIYRLDIGAREPARVSPKDQPARAPVWFTAAGDTP